MLDNAGYRVIRFWAVNVMKDEVAVARTVLRELRGAEAANSEESQVGSNSLEPPP